MKIGYVRVSTSEQNEERQLIKMRELDIPERFIFVDKMSGKTMGRPEYQKMKLCLRRGDVLYLDELSRLGRNYDDILAEWRELVSVGVDIICLDNPDIFNTQKWKEMGDVGKVMQDTILSLLAYVADTERQKMLRRQREGIAVAKAAGKYKGRKKIAINEKHLTAEIEKWQRGEQTAREAMRVLGVKPNTFYRRAKELNQAE